MTKEEKFNSNSYEEMRDTYLDSPCTSFWLKDAIKSIERRDILDSWNDIQELVLMHKKYQKKWRVKL